MATTVADFLKANPNYIGRANVPVPQTIKKTSGRGGPLTAFISEGGGAAGAWGGGAAGAAAGTAIFPGVGTLIGGIIGAGIGGFAGGTGGKALENKVRDDQNFTGKGGSARSAFTEGAISGALGSAGKGVSAVRGLKAVGGYGELKALSGGSDDVLKASSKALLSGGKKAGLRIAGESADGRLLSGASRLESRALGFGQGEKINGQQVKPKDIQELFGIMKSEGIKSGHPDLVGKQIETKIGKVGAAIEKELLNSNRPLTSAEQSFLKDGFTKQVSGDIMLSTDKSAQQLAKVLGKKMGSINSLEDLVKQRRAIQDGINFTRNAAVAEPAKEKVLLVAQENLNKLASTISPELKTLNGRFSGLTKLEQATLNSSKNLTSQSRNSMGGVLGSLKAGDTATTLKSVIGAAGRNVGGATDAIAQSVPVRAGKSMLSRGMINGTVGAMDQMNQPQDPTQVDQAMSDLGMTPDMGGGQDMTQGQQMQQPQAELYPAQNMMQDIQRDFQATGGKNVDKYLSLYKALSAVTQAQSKTSGLNVTKPTSEKFANAQSGLNSLNQYQQLLQQDPSILTKSATPGRSLPVVGGYISRATGTGTSDALAYDMMDNLLRIRTGAQANPAEIKNYVTKMLPRAGDTPQTVERKLAIFRNTFGEILDLAGAQDQNSTLQDAILNAGGSM